MRNKAALVALVWAAAGWAGEWRMVTAPLLLTFPTDHGAHPEFRTEWWYVTGLVADPGGNRFGYQLTFFRQGVRPGSPNPAASEFTPHQALAAHLAIADLGARRLHHAQRLRRVAVGLAGFTTGDLRVWLEDWEMARATGDVLHLSAHHRDERLGLELRLHPTRPLVRHGDGGVSRKGEAPGNASAYLSWTRLATTGALTVGGRTHQVTGTSWLDHEWGSTQLGSEVVGWDWLGARLDDQRDLMVYRLRRADGSASPYSAGTVVAPDGSTLALHAHDIAVTTLSRWISPRTGAAYPARLRLHIPRAGLDLTVTPLLADAEIDGRASTGVIYWEGPVTISGSTTGDGYLELTGYAGSLTGRL